MTGIQLTELRRRHGIRQDELADEIGITPAYLCMMESGKRRISERMAERINKAAQAVCERQQERREKISEVAASVMGKRHLVEARRRAGGFQE